VIHLRMSRLGLPTAVPIALIVALVASGCASVPTGPSVMVLPGTGKSFEVFQTDDAVCRQWAAQQTGTSPGKASTESTVGGAAIGTLVGAAAGAALGAAAGNPAIGASRAEAYGGSVQRRYDMAYTQCMYAKGNQVPMARGSRIQQPAAAAPPPPPPPPPPPAAVPPGTPPPPPGPPPPPPTR
jgi:hypothetical protein